MKLTLISTLIIFFLLSCGSGGESFLSTIKKQSKGISIFIIKNASNATYTNLESIKKDYIIQTKTLSSNINCKDLEFTTLSEENDTNNRTYLKYTKAKRTCEVADFKKSEDSKIKGSVNKILLMKNGSN